MQCPKCDHPRGGSDETCRGCGLVFYKYEAWLRQQQAIQAQANSIPHDTNNAEGLWTLLMAPSRETRDYTLPLTLLWALFVIWGGSYSIQGIDSLGQNPGFLHNINLPFHEAGHLIFGIFGQFIGSLGGTLGQLLMPAIAGITLLWKRQDTFGASICLWWFGQNFLDIAPYMADARAGVLPLLGGNYGNASPYGFHDWEYLLNEMNLLAYDTTLAAGTLNLGRLMMIAAMIWGGWLLWQCWRQQTQ